MRTTLLLLIFFLFNSSISAQRSSEDSLIAINVNEALWKAFKKAYDAKDAKAFNAVHTKDVMRVSPWGIKIGQDYFNSNTKHFSENSDRSQYIDFAMEHRVYDGEHGYEVGYYRIVYSVDDEVVHTSYAQFHVRLRRVEGVWKIAQDWDVNHVLDYKFSEKDFLKADVLKL